MKKILRFSFVALLAMMFGNVMATDITILPSDFTAATTSDFSTTKDGITVAVTASTVTSDQIRIFKGKTITISSTVDNITKVVFTCTASGTDKYGPGCFEDATSGTYSYDGATGTWVGDAASFSLTAKSNQVRATSIVVTVGGTVDTRKATTIEFAEGYQTQIAKGPDGMFPEVGSSVALPTATVMADGAAVAGTNIEWSLEVKSWKEKSEGEQPILKDGKISFEGHGVVSVKATYAGNDAYQASSKSYTLTIYNSYGLLNEMVEDIADPDCTKDDEDDDWGSGGGKPVFYFFRNIDADGLPVATSTVTYVNGKYIYLTDGNANLLFYGTNSQNLKQGDVISGNVSDTNLGGFWGYLKRYKKLPEFAFTNMNVKVESEGATVEPTTITIDQLKDNINAYVIVENAEFVSASSKNLTFKVGETELALYNQFSVDATALEANAKYTIEGMVSVNKKDKESAAVYQLYPISFTKAAEETTTDQVWDFTTWSAETVAALKADAAASKLAGWSDVEKQTDAEADADPTETSKDNCFWCVAEPNEDGSLSANGQVIAELKGLIWNSNYTVKRSLAIAVNYPSTSLGDYAGGAYLWLGGGKKKVPCFTIPSVKAGSTVTMEVESHKPAEGRGVELYTGVDGDGLVDAATKIGDTFNPTTKETHTWTVENDCDVIVYNTNGCHIYSVKVALGDETGISSVAETKKVQNGTIYNMAGQVVDKGYKGLVIVNGKKYVNK